MINLSSDGKGIVWIASYPKSGNTWLRVFLYHLIGTISGHITNEYDLNDINRASFYEARLSQLFEEFLGKPIESASIEDVSGIRPRVQMAIRDRCDGVAIVKTHNCLADVVGFPLINLAITLGAVYIVRDPRDVVLSLAHHLGADIDSAIDVMASPAFSIPNAQEGPFEVWGSWSEHVMSWTRAASEPLLVLRYEDLNANPIGQFTKVAAHLRIRAETEVIARAVELSAFQTLASAERKSAFNETSERADHFFREGRVGAWRERLSRQQAEKVGSAHVRAMLYCGYAVD